MSREVDSLKKALGKSWSPSLGTSFNKTVTVDYRPIPPDALHLDRDCTIALVPMETKLHYFEGKPDAYGFKERARIKEPEAGKIARQMVDRVRAACQAGAKVVCCSEYSYSWHRDNELRPAFLELSSRYECYILAGSHVQQKPKKAYNTAMLFAPRQTEPWLVYKSVRAKQNKEKIDVPPPTVNVFCGLHWSFAVMICSDILSDDMLYNLPKANYPFGLYKPIDLVLVPSRSDDQEVAARARLTSDLAKACVVYVNDAVGGQSRVFALNEEEAVETLPQSPWEEDCGAILMYSFDWIRFRLRRLEASDNVEIHQVPRRRLLARKRSQL